MPTPIELREAPNTFLSMYDSERIDENLLWAIANEKKRYLDYAIGEELNAINSSRISVVSRPFEEYFIIDANKASEELIMAWELKGAELSNQSPSTK